MAGLLAGALLCAAAHAVARQPIRIAPQPLAPALQIFARESHIQVVYRSELVGGQKTSGVDGNFTFEEALARLLSGTGLTYQYLADRAITLVPLATVPVPAREDKSALSGGPAETTGLRLKPAP